MRAGRGAPRLIVSVWFIYCPRPCAQWLSIRIGVGPQQVVSCVGRRRSAMAEAHVMGIAPVAAGMLGNELAVDVAPVAAGMPVAHVLPHAPAAAGMPEWRSPAPAHMPTMFIRKEPAQRAVVRHVRLIERASDERKVRLMATIAFRWPLLACRVSEEIARRRSAELLRARRARAKARAAPKVRPRRAARPQVKAEPAA